MQTAQLGHYWLSKNKDLSSNQMNSYKMRVIMVCTCKPSWNQTITGSWKPAIFGNSVSSRFSKSSCSKDKRQMNEMEIIRYRHPTLISSLYIWTHRKRTQDKGHIVKDACMYMLSEHLYAKKNLNCINSSLLLSHTLYPSSAPIIIFSIYFLISIYLSPYSIHSNFKRCLNVFLSA